MAAFIIFLCVLYLLYSLEIVLFTEGYARMPINFSLWDECQRTPR